MEAPIDWLLEGEPWIQYRTRLDLLGETGKDPQVISVHEAMLEDNKIKGLLVELSSWPGTVISSHKSAGQQFHKLTFISDLGLKADDPGMVSIIERVMDHQSAEGPFKLAINVPTHFGGSGEDIGAWALCDTPLILYALAKFGLCNNPKVLRAAEYLAGLVRSNGWPCACSKELGKFRGPGRKDDPCPYANLAMLKALLEFEQYRDSAACLVGVETQLTLWKESLTQHPYMFYMGTDFRKLKVPFVWYDLLHVLDVLSRFPWVIEDERYQEMIALLKSKSDLQGRFTVESVWTAWKEWEFGQKKLPSRWLTLQAWKIINGSLVTSSLADCRNG